MRADRNGVRLPDGLDSAVSLHFPGRFGAQWQTELQSESKAYREII